MSNGDSQQVAAAVTDPVSHQIAALYAQALLDAGEQAGQTEALLAELDSFIKDVLDVFPRLEEVLASHIVSHEKKEPLLDRVLGSQASPLMLNFLKVLSRRGRFDVIRGVCRAAHDAYGEMRGRVKVQVKTAVPLEGEIATTLEAQLRTMLGGEPQLERVTDPRLIGGIVLRIGDTVYDGSIATQLHRIQGQLLDRSIHEIQSRRDRFGDPTGD